MGEMQRGVYVKGLRERREKSTRKIILIRISRGFYRNREHDS
jgi:hypothetical protein